MMKMVMMLMLMLMLRMAVAMLFFFTDTPAAALPTTSLRIAGTALAWACCNWNYFSELVRFRQVMNNL
eukprot:90848-Lingulodinium_polyedra.AAC.1